MAPARRDKANRVTHRSQVETQPGAASKVVQPYGLPVQTQQAILNIFTHALPLTDHDLKTTVQKVKGHLYDRDFAAAFSKPEYLHVYALRWSAARALAYSHILTQSDRREWFLPQTSKHLLEASTGSSAQTVDDHAFRLPTKIACIGGGAGAEIVALAAAFRVMDLSHPLEVYAIDVADWAEPVARLLAALTTPPPLSTHTSDAVKAANRVLIDPSQFLVHFCHQDVLEPCSSPAITATSQKHQQPKPMTEKTTAATATSILVTTSVTQEQQKPSTPEPASNQDTALSSILSTATMCTMMFTLNELFSTSIAKTTAMLLSLTDAMQPQSRLVVVDSPGSYSEIKFGPSNKPGDEDKVTATTTTTTSRQQAAPQTKKYPMKWLLDHTLLEMAGPQKWKKVESEDSVWFRIEDPDKKLRYPLELENCRYQIHVYQRL